ncbi:hypothetical protein MTO96_048016 [Rhipicephalus appendiculatus]
MGWVSCISRLLTAPRTCGEKKFLHNSSFSANFKCTQRKWWSSSTGIPSTEGRAEGFNLNADGYARFQAYAAGENKKALDTVAFRHASAAFKQHLEIGCGPGGSTKSHVLPHCSPCSRLVATDKAPDMIEAARKTSSHPCIRYDVLDIEAGDVRGFVNKYGQFDRVYSLLTWHFHKDQLKGYRNVRHLLKNSGECLVSACIESLFLNVWLDVYLMDKWKPFIPCAMLVNTRCFSWSWRDESFVADSSLTASVEPLLRNSHRRVWHSAAADAAR